MFKYGLGHIFLYLPKLHLIIIGKYFKGFDTNASTYYLRPINHLNYKK